MFSAFPEMERTLEQLAPSHVEDVQREIFDPLTPEQTEALADAVSSSPIPCPSTRSSSTRRAAERLPRLRPHPHVEEA